MKIRNVSMKAATAAAAGALILSACSPTTEETEEPSASSSASPTVEVSSEPSTVESETPTIGAAPADVPAQLQFQATTVTGESFDGASILGTPTLIWFWAEWCTTCNLEAPGIADALDEIPANVQVLGMPGVSAQNGMERFVERHGLESIQHVIDPDGSLWSNFEVPYQPALVIIDAEGNVETVPGSVGKDGLIQAAESIA